MSDFTGDMVAWLIVIVVAAMWFFARKGRQVREREETERNRKGQAKKELIADAAYSSVENVVRNWGKFVENADLDLLEIRDESELPYSKKQIEEACLIAMAASEGTAFSGAIGATLLALAQFQPNVGPPLKHPSSAILSMRMGTGETMNDNQFKELMKKSVEAQEASSASNYRKFKEMSDAETNRLYEKIKAVS